MIVKICSATLLKDIEWLGKMDPYCEMYLNPTVSEKRHQKILTTHTEHDKGKVPVWGE